MSARGVQREVDARSGRRRRPARSRCPARPGAGRRAPSPGRSARPRPAGSPRSRWPRRPRCSAGSAPRWRSAGPADSPAPTAHRTLTARHAGQLGTPGDQRRRARSPPSASTLRHRATASAGAAIAAISGPDVDTARIADGHQQRGRPAAAARPCSAGGAASASGRTACCAHRTIRAPSPACGTLGTVIADRRRRAGDRALVEEACRKSALLWLRPTGTTAAQAAWHVWVDGAVHVVSGGLEQPLPGPRRTAAEVDVTAAQQGHLGPAGHVRATVATVEPGDDAWASRRPRAARQTAQPTRRRGAARRGGPASPGSSGSSPPASCVESPGHMPHRLARAPSRPGSPATTRGPLPFVVGRRARRRPSASTASLPGTPVA